jgi:hypothetical protein
LNAEHGGVNQILRKYDVNDFAVSVQIYAIKASNAQSGFAALVVHGEADAACPFVKGTSRRVSKP